MLPKSALFWGVSTGASAALAAVGVTLIAKLAIVQPGAQVPLASLSRTVVPVLLESALVSAVRLLVTPAPATAPADTPIRWRRQRQSQPSQPRSYSPRSSMLCASKNRRCGHRGACGAEWCALSCEKMGVGPRAGASRRLGRVRICAAEIFRGRAPCRIGNSIRRYRCAFRARRGRGP